MALAPVLAGIVRDRVALEATNSLVTVTPNDRRYIILRGLQDGRYLGATGEPLGLQRGTAPAAGRAAAAGAALRCIDHVDDSAVWSVVADGYLHPPTGTVVRTGPPPAQPHEDPGTGCDRGGTGAAHDGPGTVATEHEVVRTEPPPHEDPGTGSGGTGAAHDDPGLGSEQEVVLLLPDRFLTSEGCGTVFTAQWGPESLPSEYLATLTATGVLCMPSLLSPRLTAELRMLAARQRQQESESEIDRTDPPQLALRAATAIQAAMHPVALWVIRSYMQTEQVQLAHWPGFAILRSGFPSFFVCDFQ